MPKIPGVNHLDAVRALEKAGFRIVRQGKHIVMSNDQRIVTIPRHNPVNAFTMDAAAEGDIRVIDESGEDYLYSADRFVEIEPPQTVRRSLLHAGKAA